MVRLHTRLNMLAAKDSKPVTSGERETTTTENEKSSTTSTPQPSGLGELAATATAPAGRGQGAVQRVQVGSAPGADKSEMSREGASRRSSPTPATRPIKYTLEIGWSLRSAQGCMALLKRLLWRRLRCGDPKPGLPQVYGLIPGCGRPYGGLLWEEGPFQGGPLARTGYSS